MRCQTIQFDTFDTDTFDTGLFPYTNNKIKKNLK